MTKVNLQRESCEGMLGCVCNKGGEVGKYFKVSYCTGGYEFLAGWLAEWWASGRVCFVVLG